VKYPNVIKSAKERFSAGTAECDARNSGASGTPLIGEQLIEPAAVCKAFTANYCNTLQRMYVTAECSGHVIRC
jgi:hypothetical protein